jgi:uncharacterized membrane protein YfcA
MALPIAGLVLGVVVGAVLGLTGAGGSVLAVPLLMIAYGWTVPQAAPVALIAVAAAAAGGAYTAWRRSYVRYRAAALMGFTGSLVSPLGVTLAAHAPVKLLEGLFAVVMVIVGVRLWRQARSASSDSDVVRAAVAGEGAASRGHLCHLNPHTGRLLWTPRTAAVIGAIGALTGFLSGLLGVGGGFIVVPALRAVSPLSMNSAVATSLMTIALVAGGTVIFAVLGGPGLPWEHAGPFVAGALIGMLAARGIAHRVAGHHLQGGFAVITLIVACGLGGHAVGLW